MRLILSILICASSLTLLGQTKDELVKKADKDSVMLYEGEGAMNKGNCVFIKFSGDPQLFFNELAGLHAQDEKQVERTKFTISIYETMKPYWVFGRYSVYGMIEQKDNYAYIEIYFKAYSNPENFKMIDAPDYYQKLVNKILGKG